MMKYAALIACVLAAWHFWDREWFSGALWVLAAIALAFGHAWWRSARAAWRD
jgi:hypothetical protein